MSENTMDKAEEIAALESELYAGQQRLAELRRSAGPEPVEDYVLQGPDGDVRLSEAFGDKPDLIVVHNMGRACPYCTMWADGWNGFLDHIADRAAFVVVSVDTPDVQAEFAASRDWRFRMLSAAGSSFTADMGYAIEREGRWAQQPGVSTFRKQADGSIARIAHASFGPGDPYCGVWHLFALLDGGVGDWQAKFTYT